MGRPSKLTGVQWEALLQRLSNGEKAADLAREYGVSKATVSKRVSQPAAERSERVKNVAQQLVAAESSYRALPLSERQDVDSHKALLLNTMTHLGHAAQAGAAISHRLTRMAESQLQLVDDTDPLAGLDHLKAVSTCVKVANDAAHISLNLLAANKPRVERIADDQERQQGSGTSRAIGTDPIAASRAYMDIMAGKG